MVNSLRAYSGSFCPLIPEQIETGNMWYGGRNFTFETSLKCIVAEAAGGISG
jgi:hypothetical protein